MTRAADEALCQSCGACCAYSADWPRFALETDAAIAAIPPRLCRRRARDACAAIGDRCSGADRRGRRRDRVHGLCGAADVCRECQPGDAACTMARRRFTALRRSRSLRLQRLDRVARRPSRRCDTRRARWRNPHPSNARRRRTAARSPARRASRARPARPRCRTNRRRATNGSRAQARLDDRVQALAHVVAERRADLLDREGRERAVASGFERARERAAEIAVDQRPAERAQRVAAGLGPRRSRRTAASRPAGPRRRRRRETPCRRRRAAARARPRACPAARAKSAASRSPITPGGTATIAARAVIVALRRRRCAARAPAWSISARRTIRGGCRAPAA